MMILWPDGGSEPISDIEAALIRVRKRYAGLSPDAITIAEGEIRVRGVIRGRVTTAASAASSGQPAPPRVEILPPDQRALTLIWTDGRRDAVADYDDALALARQRYSYMRASSVTMIADEIHVHGVRKARLTRGLAEALALEPPVAIRDWQLSVAWSSGPVSPISSIGELSSVIAENVKENAVLTNNLVYSAGSMRGRLRLCRTVILPEPRIASGGSASAPRTVQVRAHTRRLPNSERY
jgi:hypothetical protein